MRPRILPKQEIEHLLQVSQNIKLKRTSQKINFSVSLYFCLALCQTSFFFFFVKEASLAFEMVKRKALILDQTESKSKRPS